MSGTFHFLRPWWLIGLPLTGLLWMYLRRHQTTSNPWRGIVAPHLLEFLLSGQKQRTYFTPLRLLGISWAITIIAIAGPAWRREPSPFAEDKAALAIVLKVAPSMKTTDVQPDRLARAAQKIHDLLAQRPGAKTALIAYAGTSHLVMPVTTDAKIIETFASALDPALMPVDGDSPVDAFRLAQRSLATAGSGSILWIADSVAPAQSSALAKWHKQSPISISLIPPLTAGAELDAMRGIAREIDATFVRLTADDGDVTELARAAEFSTITNTEQITRWQESGYWLTPIVATLVLTFFRRGWIAGAAAQT